MEGRQEGEIATLQSSIEAILRCKFAHLPEPAIEVVKANTDVVKLREMLIQVSTAAVFEELVELWKI